MKHFIKDTLDGFVFVDHGVYTKNRLFRIIYSYKANKSPESALKPQGDNNDTYNENLVLMTLLQSHTPNNSHFYEYHVFDEKRLRDQIQTSSYSQCTLSPGFISYINKKGYKIISSRENENVISCILAGVKCPWVERIHKSNHVYLFYNKNSYDVWFKCSDPGKLRVVKLFMKKRKQLINNKIKCIIDCPKVPFYNFNAWFI